MSMTQFAIEATGWEISFLLEVTTDAWPDVCRRLEEAPSLDTLGEVNPGVTGFCVTELRDGKPIRVRWFSPEFQRWSDWGEPHELQTGWRPIVTSDQIIQEMFDSKLEEILDEETGGSLLTIPGLYEVVSEHFNNQILEALQKARTDPEEHIEFPRVRRVRASDLGQFVRDLGTAPNVGDAPGEKEPS